MSRLLVRSFAVSADGFGAGPDQDLEHPLGVGGEELMEWFFHTRTWRAMHGEAGGDTGIDDEIAARGMQGFGAWILGRNMFGPVRGPWPDESWKGWWGDEPPYHVPTFVLTHHARRPVMMKGGTEFRFVTDGIHSALQQARAAVGDRDIRVGGGVSTIRQFLQAGLIDELHLALRPVLLGKGEQLFAGIDLRAAGYQVAEHLAGERAMHLFIRRSGAEATRG
jgi:dihydrofolate reductase